MSLSCQRGTESTAGDIHRWPRCSKSPMLPGGSCRSLEAIAANNVYAPRRQLRLCKWLCSVVIWCHFNCISNVKCQLCRVGDAEGKSGTHKCSWKCVSSPNNREPGAQDIEMFLFGGKPKTDSNFLITALLQALKLTALK